MSLSCACGSVEFQAFGHPILTSVCYCDDCQKAGHQIESLPQAPSVVGHDGGTAYILYRRDRVTCLRGSERLAEHRVEGEAFTKRVVAACCNSGMYLDFEKGHWLSLYRDRFRGQAPAVEMLIQTKYKPAETVLPQDIPSFSGFPLKFIGKIMRAKFEMMFGR
ncbi:MAG: hypothetical protein HKM06_02105 [Spirochaetales bacterium]|nr:hypothetical protein [Spirochaetales bacterium]